MDKSIYDPIYGFIKLNSDYMKIVDHLLIQRLRHISQLGLAEYVFPNARSNRFTHSLGVYHLVGKFIQNLKPITERDSSSNNILSAQEKKIIECAGLLHDVGHLPYSHTIEHIFERYFRKNQNLFHLDNFKFGEDKFHEWLGGEIVKKTHIYELNNSILEITNDREFIAQVIMGKSKNNLFRQIIHSDLDADRLDYIGRDAFAAGIPYGKLDLEQLFRKIYIVNDSGSGTDKIIAYSIGATRAIDQIYYTRIMNYQTISYHRLIEFYNYLIAESYWILIDSTNEELKKIEFLLPEKPEILLNFILNYDTFKGQNMNVLLDDFILKWYQFDDHYLWNLLRNCWYELKKVVDANLSPKEHLLKLYLEHLFNRTTSEVIWEKNELIIKKNETSEPVLEEILIELKNWIETEFNFKIKERNIGKPLLVIMSKISLNLSEKGTGDPISLDEYNGNGILFIDIKKNTFHDLSHVRSSLNYQSIKDKFIIFRVFNLGSPTNNSSFFDAIQNKYNEINQMITGDGN